MKWLENLKDNIFSQYLHFDQGYQSCEELVITCQCPFCKEYTDIDAPDDDPPTGKKKGISWCIWCGKEFQYYY